MQNTLETQIINKAERKVYKPLIKFKHEESVMPSYEIILKRNYLLVLRSMEKIFKVLVYKCYTLYGNTPETHKTKGRF